VLQYYILVVKEIILASLQPKVNFNLTANDNYKDNLIKVELYFESFDFELIQEVPAYLVSIYSNIRIYFHRV